MWKNDFILLHGCDVVRGPGADGEATEKDLGDFFQQGRLSFSIMDILKRCAVAAVPMICANPVLSVSDRTEYCQYAGPDCSLICKLFR
jgi:hypothetical protein